LLLFLAACGTSVPLSDIPVTDGTVKGVSASTAGTGDANSGGFGNNVVQVEVGKNVTKPVTSVLANVVYFDFDSFVIQPEYQAIIASQARSIKGQPSQKVAIEGHADERGGREYNLALGQKRADAVSSALLILGVPQNQMEAVSFGEEKPVMLGADEVAYAKNRRVEIRIQ
jgi:peptidoglycan-associated lipoprotein